MMTYLAESPSPEASDSDELLIPAGLRNARVRGEAFAVDDWKRLERFLVFGREDGCYRAESALALDQANGVFRCLVTEGPRAVRRIVEMAEAGRPARPDAGLFVLALAASDRAAQETRAAALAALPRVCRTGAQLLHFARYVDELRGWGRGLRNAVAGWYQQPLEYVAREVALPHAHEGWSHRDLLRLAHPKPPTPGHQALFGWIVRGAEPLPGSAPPELRPLVGRELARRARDPEALIEVVRAYGLSPDAVPARWLGVPEVREALLGQLPVQDLLPWLPRLVREGLLTDPSAIATLVAARLADAGELRGAQAAPAAVLAAWAGCRRAVASDGADLPQVHPILESALETAFHMCLANVRPTGKRWLVSLDVSGSMATGAVSGIGGFSPREVAAAMALTVAREDRCTLVGFTAGPGGLGGRWDDAAPALSRLCLSPGARLSEVVRFMGRLPMGGTDCALPMRWALERKLPVDVFAIFTDAETWFGSVSPAEALREYRERMGTPAKLAVVGLRSEGFSIADPLDAGMLDVVGFDPATPRLIADFARC